MELNLEQGKGKQGKQAPTDGVVVLDPVRDSLDELEALCEKKIAAADKFSTACETVALKSNLQPTVLKAFVTARVRDKIEEHEKKSEQMQLLLEEIDA